ncbi:MAG: CCA tRNA nucleotidyltransferase [Phycisphaerae bacterium]|jgi:poly(A) polymerase
MRGIMLDMSDSFPLTTELPTAAQPAVAIVRRLVDAGHVALLAGGCVRDLLRGDEPNDYDVATDAPPKRVQALFRPTRLVGAQFGVVLVRQRRRWIEVATFRTDGPYLDGRHPAHVEFTNAREDARRRDFTVNGMFLDPLSRQVIDHVGGRADLQAGLIRAIGDPVARFDEDQLRLLRAVRFAARLDFTIEPATLAAIREHADRLTAVAAERIREELEKALGNRRRARALRLLRETGLLPYLWAGATWHEEHLDRAQTLLERLPADAGFELALAVLLADRDHREVRDLGPLLALANRQRDTIAWLVQHHANLDDADAPTLADFKRLLADPAFPALRQFAEARYGDLPDGPQRQAALATRIAAIPSEAISPAPLVTGDDLTARGIPPGPIYGDLLETLYTEQLGEVLTTREAALARLATLLVDRGHHEQND